MINPELKQYIDSQIAQEMRKANEGVEGKLREQVHDGNYSQRVNLFDIFGNIETVTTAPATAPTGGSPYDQLKIHYNSVGPVWRLYIYDYQNSAWKYTVLT